MFLCVGLISIDITDISTKMLKGINKTYAIDSPFNFIVYLLRFKYVFNSFKKKQFQFCLLVRSNFP